MRVSTDAIRQQARQVDALIALGSLEQYDRIHPLVVAVLMVCDKLDEHDRSLRAAFDAVGP
jgi:hypothetical protein